MSNHETNITVNDLALLVQLIDVCAARGGIKAAEMTIVGPVYDKLLAQVRRVEELRKAADEATEEATEEATGIPTSLGSITE